MERDQWEFAKVLERGSVYVVIEGANGCFMNARYNISVSGKVELYTNRYVDVDVYLGFIFKLVSS